MSNAWLSWLSGWCSILGLSIQILTGRKAPRVQPRGLGHPQEIARRPDDVDWETLRPTALGASRCVCC